MVETTPWHPFYTPNGWANAASPTPGDQLLSLHGDTGTVDAVVTVDVTQTMYDLDVAVVDTFAVGSGAWVVHNCPDLQPPLFPDTPPPRLPNAPSPDVRATQLSFSPAMNDFRRRNLAIGVGDVRDPQTGDIYRLVSMGDRQNRTLITEYVSLDELASNNEYMVPPQGGTGHAEDNIVLFAQARGWEVLEVGASLPVCTACQTTITNAGGIPVGRLR